MVNPKGKNYNIWVQHQAACRAYRKELADQLRKS